MKYGKFQMKYINSVDGAAHMSAVEIIGELERAIEAKDGLLRSYRLGGMPNEKTMQGIDR